MPTNDPQYYIQHKGYFLLRRLCNPGIAEHHSPICRTLSYKIPANFRLSPKATACSVSQMTLWQDLYDLVKPRQTITVNGLTGILYIPCSLS